LQTECRDAKFVSFYTFLYLKDFFKNRICVSACFFAEDIHLPFFYEVEMALRDNTKIAALQY